MIVSISIPEVLAIEAPWWNAFKCQSTVHRRGAGLQTRARARGAPGRPSVEASRVNDLAVHQAVPGHAVDRIHRQQLVLRDRDRHRRRHAYKVNAYRDQTVTCDVRTARVQGQLPGLFMLKKVGVVHIFGFL